MSKYEEQVEKKIETNRNFSYQLGNVTLSFGLHLDDTESLEQFRKLLESALEDVEKTIETNKNV